MSSRLGPIKVSKEKIKKLLKLMKFEPRAYQKDVVEAFRKSLEENDTAGIKYFSTMWHRRAGKDRKDWAFLCVLAALVPGTYYYFFPTKTAAVENVFEGMDGGLPWIKMIPEELVQKINRTRSFIQIKGTNSIIRFKGTDKDQIEDLRGFSVKGAVLSEASQHSDNIWPVIMPALLETNGWLFLNSTPNGRDWYWRMHQDFLAHPKPNLKHVSTLTADDTGVLSKDQLEEQRKQCKLMYGDETLFYQEYYCRADVGALGAIYHTELITADKENRIGTYAYDNQYPVHTFWDLGRDGTAIWFMQVVGNKHIFIDYEEMVDNSMTEYVKMLKEKPYRYGEHYLPWDADKRDVKDDHTPRGILENLFIKNKIKPDTFITDRVSSKNDMLFATRNVFRHAHFDKVNCAEGLLHLELYHRSFDKKKRIYSKDPVHDQHSHAADAFGIWGMNYFLVRQHETIHTFEDYNNGGGVQQADIWEWKL